MNALAKFFIDNYKFTFVLSIGVAIFGFLGLMQVKSESYPAVDFAMATVTTNYDGASTEDIETRITKPIEDEIRTVSGIKDVRSTSQPGLSTILIRADLDNINVKQVMGDLQRAVDRVSNLPPDLKDNPKFQEIKSEEFPVMEIAVVGENENRRRDIVVDLLKEEIEDNKAVLSVRKVGSYNRTFQIRLNTEKLKALHIGIDEVMARIRERNVNIPGGKLESSSNQKLVRITGKINDKVDLEELIVRANFSGKVIRLKDIANVYDDKEDPKVMTTYDGKDSALMVVTKKGGADTLVLVDDLNKKFTAFKKKYGNEFEFVVYNNESLRVKNKLGVLTSNAVSGLVLVVFFLLLFLPGRIGLMASLSLPLAIMATIGFVPPMDMNLNAVTILAFVIALGMLVDNSVVISENYARLRGEGHKAREAVLESVRQLWLPITATVMTTIAAFLPMLVTKGIMGEFIKYIPIIVTVALLMSLVESFFLLPMRLIVTDAKVKHIKGSGWFDKIADRFEGLMYKVVKLRYLALFVFTGLLFGSIVMMTVFNKMVLFPADQTEIYISRIELQHGVTLEDTKIALDKIVKAINEKASDHFDHVVARAGTGQMGPMDPKGKDGDNVGIIFLYANDETKNFVKDSVVLEKLRAIQYPPLVTNLTFEVQAQGPPVGDAVNVTFRSNNMVNLKAMVGDVVARLESTSGIRDVKTDDIVGDDEVFVDIDTLKASRLGLSVDSIGNSIRTAISGRKASEVNLDNKEVDIVVRLDEEDRVTVEDLNDLMVMDPRGNLIPVNRFATFRVEKATPYIKRFDFKRSKTVTAGIDDKVITAIEANKVVEDSYAELTNKYDDVSLVFGGEGESTKESMDSLWSALVLSLIGIFALLVFLFNSLLRPIIIMTTIPLGLVGFSIAFAAHGRPISFLALIGVIGLGGIIVNSGIILISFIEELKAEGKMPLIEVLAKASRLRLRAVVVSSLTTISGLLPTAYGIGGSDSMLIPMTLAMAWGLTSGTILTLIWVPAAYAIIEDIAYVFSRLMGSRSKKEQEEKNNSGEKDKDRKEPLVEVG